MAACRAGEARHVATGVEDRALVLAEHRAARAERDHDVAGRDAEAEGGGHVVTGAGCDEHPGVGLAEDLRGAGHPWGPDEATEGPLEQVGPVLARDR